MVSLVREKGMCVWNKWLTVRSLEWRGGRESLFFLYPFIVFDFLKNHVHVFFFLSFLRENHLYWFLRGAITSYYKLDGLKPQKFTVSQFQRLKIQNQGVGRVMIPLKAMGKNTSLLLPSFSWFANSPWLLGLQLQHCNLCLCYQNRALPSYAWVSNLFL